MCDYSLHAVASRPAKVGERLVSTKFRNTETRGFAAPEDPATAVCLLPGTELVFDQNVQIAGLLFNRTTESNVARFREVDENEPYRHHDALELADGQIVLLTDLKPGQQATVLQLPATAQPERKAVAEPIPSDAAVLL
jgi:hypothetical protein